MEHQQRRREQRGWVWYDVANSVFPTSVVTVFFSLYLTSIAQSPGAQETAVHAPVGVVV